MQANEKTIAFLDIPNQEGLEIGPLDNPCVNSSEGWVKYVDHLSTAGLREKYSCDPNVDVQDIVNIDYVWGEKNLRQSVGEGVFFDYVIASHVIEHVPDVVGWLFEISEVLRVGGKLSLVIPDMRFTFDCQRHFSRPADFVEAFLLQRRKPSVRQVFDSHFSSAPVESQVAWGRNFDPASVARFHSHPKGVFELCRDMVENDVYIDSHCFTFTPDSFLDTFEFLVALDLIDFELTGFFPTVRPSMEFHATLTKLPDNITRPKMQEFQLASLEQSRKS